MIMSPEWAELLAGIIGAILGWIARHFGPPRA